MGKKANHDLPDEDEVLRRMLKTPHKPLSESKKGGRRSHSREVEAGPKPHRSR